KKNLLSAERNLKAISYAYWTTVRKTENSGFLLFQFFHIWPIPYRMCRSAQTDAPIKHYFPTWHRFGLSDTGHL
ncbi:hypothetical protein ACPFUD_003612, partial [Vibrio cholerae]